MKTAYDIIIKPIITEHSMSQTAGRKYTFEVDRRVNKTEVKGALEQIFGITVANVNTVVVKGKPKKQGRFVGRTRTWKKAIVTLTANSKEIEFFEGM